MSTQKSYLSQDQVLVHKLYTERHPDSDYTIEISNEITYGSLIALKNKKNNKLKTRVISIDNIPSGIPYMNLGSGLNPSRKNKLYAIERSGVYSVKFSNNDEMIIAFRIFRVSKDYFIQRILCTSHETLKLFFMLLRTERMKKIKPPTSGIFVLDQDHSTGRLLYIEKKFPNPPVIHQQAAIIEKSIETYFENKERYLRNGKSGTKRILLFGLPGSGKTTLCYQIARKYAKTHLVVFCNDLNQLAQHSTQCATHGIPTIVFNEECDRWMGNHQGFAMGEAKDNVKAFLDGHLASRNKGGELNILITNYPDKIEKTILFRPGRIHERIEVGCLDPDSAVKVAKNYFVDHNNKLVCNEKELDYFKSNMYTGAQIENIASMVIDYVNGTDTIITKEVIDKVVTEFKEAVNAVRNYKDPHSLVDAASPRKVGFGDEIGLVPAACSPVTRYDEGE